MDFYFLLKIWVNRYLDFFIDRSFQGVNRLFVLSFENNRGRTCYTRHYLPLIEIKDYNIIIDRRSFFDQSVKNNLIIYNKIWKIATGQKMITQLVVY